MAYICFGLTQKGEFSDASVPQFDAAYKLSQTKAIDITRISAEGRSGVLATGLWTVNENDPLLKTLEILSKGVVRLLVGVIVFDGFVCGSSLLD